MDLLNKKSLVNSKLTTLSLARECKLIGIHRSSLYYKPKDFSIHDIKTMHRIDEIFTQMPFYGHRRICRQLINEDIAIEKHRVARYMKILGIRALYPTKKRNTSMRNIRTCKKAQITQLNQV